MRLIFDFDGTITQNDTIGELAKGGLNFQQTQHGQNLTTQWDQVVKAYMDDYGAYKANYPANEDDRRSVLEEVEFLAGLKRVEKTSLARVEECGVFSGLQEADLHRIGVEALESKRVSIRDGFEDVVRVAKQRGWGLGVISVNWSRSFIKGVLHQFDIPVVANEISKDGKIHGPEYLGQTLTNSAGKLQVLEHEFAKDGEETIYFGDSTTDLECLLRKGIAIADNDDSSLVKTLKRLGFVVSSASERMTADKADFYWARSFREVLDSGLLEQ